MKKDSGTRSSLLWEVTRILDECEQLSRSQGGYEMPQVLLMENVPQVHSKKNMPDFQKLIAFLESKGYKNYWQDLNAKNYGVAQSRNRCFMVSLHGDYSYEFPKPIELTKNLKDYLEDEVEDKYYLNCAKARKLIMELIQSGRLDKVISEIDNRSQHSTAQHSTAQHSTAQESTSASRTLEQSPSQIALSVDTMQEYPINRKMELESLRLPVLANIN